MKQEKRKNFRKKDKIKMLLWCDRHCCLCDKSCGIDIEIAHIGENHDNDFNNGIPVCYDCHSKMGMYNKLHPKGNKLTSEEIKKRREQIYEKYTRQYTVPIQYVISNKGHIYPDITFVIANLSDSLPTKLRIILKGELNGKKIQLRLDKGHYTGDKIWNLNPLRQVNGHFIIRNTRLKKIKKSDFLNIKVNLTQIDILDREHTFLEDGYMYHSDGWYFEP